MKIVRVAPPKPNGIVKTKPKPKPCWSCGKKK